MSPFIMYSSQNPSNFLDMEVIMIKEDVKCLSPFQLNTTVCHLLFRVRKPRSQSVLPGRFSVSKSCLLWVPQCICLGSYKACSKKNLCWGRPRPEFQKLAVEKDIHHLQDFYTCLFFALPLQRQPYQGYKPTRH